MSIIAVIALGFFVFVCYLVGQGTNTAAGIAATGFFIGAFLLYFAPSFVAQHRKHPNLTSIGVLNLFLGWTVLGWVGALIWAYSSKHQVLAQVTAMPTSVAPATTLRTCPYCAEEIRVEAVKCKHCGSAVEPLPVRPDAHQLGLCQTCDAEIPMNSTKCPSCGAGYGPGMHRQVRPLNATST